MTSGNSFTRQHSKTCAKCGKLFWTFDTRVKFCSQLCRTDARARSKVRSVGVLTTCPVCAAEFVSDDRHHVYCSEECRKERNKRAKQERERERRAEDKQYEPIPRAEYYKPKAKPHTPREKPKMTLDEVVRSGKSYREIQLDELRERGLFK